MLRVLVDFSDLGLDAGLPIADLADVLLALAEDGLLMGCALPCHLREVDLATELVLGAAHLRLDTADDSFLAGVLTAQICLFDAVLDLGSGQKLALLEDLFGSLLQLLSERAQLGGRLGVAVGVDVLVEDVVAHPVDVKGAGLGTVDGVVADDLDHFCFDCFKISVLNCYQILVGGAFYSICWPTWKLHSSVHV